MVILFLKQMWMVLSLKQYAEMAVWWQEPAQEIGTGGEPLHLAVFAATRETTAGEAARSSKIKDFLCHPEYYTAVAEQLTFLLKILSVSLAEGTWSCNSWRSLQGF